jgi:hypothetical protein
MLITYESGSVVTYNVVSGNEDEFFDTRYEQHQSRSQFYILEV